MRIAWAALVVLVAAVHLGAGWQGVVPRLVFAGAVLVAFACLPLIRRAKVSVVPVLGFALAGAYLVARSDDSAPVSVLLDLLPRLLSAARPAPATPTLLLEVSRAAFGVVLAVAPEAPVSAVGAVLVLRAPKADDLVAAWNTVVAK